MRGGGNASATVDARLRGEGAGTVVTVVTDLNISGRLAQFGSGMIKEISEKLFAQFVANVETQLLATQEPEAEPEAEPEEVPAAVPVIPVSQPAPNVPLDLMQVVGASVYKRLLPAVGAAVVIAVVIYLLVR